MVENVESTEACVEVFVREVSPNDSQPLKKSFTSFRTIKESRVICLQFSKIC